MQGETVAASIITLREGVEAILLTAIIYTILSRAGKTRESRLLLAGAAGSAVVGTTLAVLVLRFLGYTSMHPLVEAAAAGLAVGVILWVVGWSAHHAKATASTAARIGGLAALGTGAIVVGREAFESILMLAPLASRAPEATLTGAAIGVLVAGVIGGAFLLAGKRLPQKQFFLASGLLLTLIAGGLAGYAVHETIEYAEEAGLDLGLIEEKVYSIELPEDHPLSENAPLGVVLQVLFGVRLEAELGSLLAQTLTVAAGLLLLFRE